MNKPPDRTADRRDKNLEPEIRQIESDIQKAEPAELHARIERVFEAALRVCISPDQEDFFIDRRDNLVKKLREREEREKNALRLSEAISGLDSDVRLTLHPVLPPDFWANVASIRRDLNTFDLPDAKREALSELLNKVCERASNLLNSQKVWSQQRTAWVLRRLDRILLVKWATTAQEVINAVDELYAVFWLITGPPENQFESLVSSDRDVCISAWENAKEAVDLAKHRFPQLETLRRKQLEAGIAQATTELVRHISFIAKLQAEIEYCNGQISGARTSGFADMVRGWLVKKEAELKRHEAGSQRMQREIDSLRQRLTD